MRILEWIFNACDNAVETIETPIGLIPNKKDINIKGIDEVEANLDELLSVNTEKWLDECELIEEHYKNFGSHLPKGLADEFEALKARLK